MDANLLAYVVPDCELGLVEEKSTYPSNIDPWTLIIGYIHVNGCQLVLHGQALAHCRTLPFNSSTTQLRYSLSLWPLYHPGRQKQIIQRKPSQVQDLCSNKHEWSVNIERGSQQINRKSTNAHCSCKSCVNDDSYVCMYVCICTRRAIHPTHTHHTVYHKHGRRRVVYALGQENGAPSIL